MSINLHEFLADRHDVEALVVPKTKHRKTQKSTENTIQ